MPKNNRCGRPKSTFEGQGILCLIFGGKLHVGQGVLSQGQCSSFCLWDTFLGWRGTFERPDGNFRFGGPWLFFGNFGGKWLNGNVRAGKHSLTWRVSIFLTQVSQQSWPESDIRDISYIASLTRLLGRTWY